MYNAADSGVRLILILIFILWSLSFFLNFQGDVAKLIVDVGPGLGWLAWLLVWGIYRAEYLSISIDGAAAEMLSPVLFIVGSILVSARYQISAYNYHLRTVCKVVAWLFLFLLCSDVLWRYLLEPDCFMVYECRFQAKTIGFFSTTNSKAMSIVVVLCLLTNRDVRNYLFERRALFYFYIFVLTLVLMSTMSRAPSLALGFVLFWIFMYRTSWPIRCVSIVLGAAFGLMFFLFDPLGAFNDQSLASKFWFFTSVGDLLLRSELESLIFGWGASYEQIVNVLAVEGWSPHSPILKVILYFGVVGLLLFILWMLWLLLLLPEIFPVIAVYLIFGFAGAPIFMPQLIFAFVMITLSREFFRIRSYTDG